MKKGKKERGKEEKKEGRKGDVRTVEPRSNGFQGTNNLQFLCISEMEHATVGLLQCQTYAGVILPLFYVRRKTLML